ncbi:MAG: ParA family protein [Mariprofundaceae bacterium]|nr:ParA family protein [Mariprofundaceae bacterium]
MKIITVMNQKGGVGKTTLALSLAARWHLAGHSVSIVDADPQQASVFWKRQQAEDSALAGIDVYSVRLPAEIRGSKNLNSDYVIVDTPGTDKMIVRSAVNVSDALLIPVQPSSLDVQASAPTVQAALATGKPVAYLVNRFVSHSQLGNDMVKLLERTSVTVLRRVMGQYQAFPRSIGVGETPSTMFSGGAACRNIESVGQVVDTWLEGEHEKN